MIIKDKLLHTYNNHTEGFFDDYAIIIKSLIKYHEITQEMKYLDTILTNRAQIKERK